MTSAAIPAVVLAAIIAAFVSGTGLVVGHLLHREEHRWRKREECLRMLRWAAEACTVDHQVEMGIAALHGLTESELLQPEDRKLVQRFCDLILPPVATEPEPDGGETFVVVGDPTAVDIGQHHPREAQAQ